MLPTCSLPEQRNRKTLRRACPLPYPTPAAGTGSGGQLSSGSSLRRTISRNDSLGACCICMERKRQVSRLGDIGGCAQAYLLGVTLYPSSSSSRHFPLASSSEFTCTPSPNTGRTGALRPPCDVRRLHGAHTAGARGAAAVPGVQEQGAPPQRLCIGLVLQDALPRSRRCC